MTKFIDNINQCDNEDIICKERFNKCLDICSNNQLYDINTHIPYGCRCQGQGQGQGKGQEGFTSVNRENNHNLIVMIAIVFLFLMYVVCRKMY